MVSETLKLVIFHYWQFNFEDNEGENSFKHIGKGAEIVFSQQAWSQYHWKEIKNKMFDNHEETHCKEMLHSQKGQY